jgi:hypothetical protein
VKRLTTAIVLAAWLPAAPALGEAPAADAKELTARIDRHLAEAWRRHKVAPAAPADDATYLRRVYLDLAGTIPPITEARDFLDDTSPGKRAALVEALLEGEAHARHFAVTWRRLLLSPDAGAATSPGLEAWLRRQFRDNAGYDRLARGLLTGGPEVDAFYQANERKPEELAASTSRVFLGARLECAQCHDHPFARYKRVQFWEMAAFFSDVSPANGPGGNRRGELILPGSGKTVKARALGAAAPAAISPRDGPRAALADWMVARDNPYFARAAVNRLWEHFFGRGLVDPADELGEGKAASHPELLDELARAFTASDCDVRLLVRAITASKAYGLSSSGRGGLRDFARMPVRRLTAEQLHASLVRVGGRPGPFGFVERFATAERPTDATTTILQALHLMNGGMLASATRLESNRSLRLLAEARGPTAGQRVEELYLLALSRRPRPEEKARLARYVEGGGPRRDPRQALSDVLWALLNSHEFGLNH